MPYIGEEPRFGSYPSQILSGDGSTTTFTMNNDTGNAASVLVCIDGVKQRVTSFAVSGTTLDFGAFPPPAGTNNIELVWMGLRKDFVLADQTLGTDAIMRTNDQNISENITIGATTNALTAGPIEVDDTYIVTVNGNWTII